MIRCLSEIWLERKNSLEGHQNAATIGTSKLIHVAGTVGAVVQLICGICAVLLTITHITPWNTAWRAWVPSGAREIAGVTSP